MGRVGENRGDGKRIEEGERSLCRIEDTGVKWKGSISNMMSRREEIEKGRGKL